MNEADIAAQRFEARRAALASRLQDEVARAIQAREQCEALAGELKDLESQVKSSWLAGARSEALARQIHAKKAELARARQASDAADRAITNLEESLRKLMSQRQ